MKRDLMKIFFDEIYSTPRKFYSTNKIFYNHIDDIWSIDLAHMIDYKISNNKGYRNICLMIVNFLEYTRCIQIKNKNSETVTGDFSKFRTTSKRRPIKLKSDRGA